MMKATAIILGAVAISAGAIGAATTMRSSSNDIARQPFVEHERPGPDSGRVATLFASLQAGDPVVCEMIADQVGNFWISSHERRIGRLSSSPLGVLSAKDSIGGRVTDPRAIALLRASLSAQNSCVRRLASKMLGASTFSARDLAALLSSPDARVRESAAFAAGHRDSMDVRSALETALGDREPAVAAMAAWALGEGEDARSIPALTRASSHADAHVRASAVWALGNLNDNDHNAQGSVLLVLESALSDRDIEVQRVAAEAFTNVEELHTAPAALVKALQASDAELRYYAAEALAQIADPLTTKYLVALIDHPDRELRKKAVEALGQIGTKEAIAGLTRALSDKDREVRKSAVEALGETKDK